MGGRLRCRPLHYRRREPTADRRDPQLAGSWDDNRDPCELVRDSLWRPLAWPDVYGSVVPEHPVRSGEHSGDLHDAVDLRDRRLRRIGSGRDPAEPHPRPRGPRSVPGETDLRERPADDPRASTPGEHPACRPDPLQPAWRWDAGTAWGLQRRTADRWAVLLSRTDPVAR